MREVEEGIFPLLCKKILFVLIFYVAPYLKSEKLI